MQRTFTITISQEETDPDFELAVMDLTKELEDLVDELEVSTDADIELEID